MKSKLVDLTGLILCSACAPTFGADYLGAEAVLAMATSATSSKSTAQQDSANNILKDLTAFKAASDLDPKAAAEQWLALVERAQALPPQLRNGDNLELAALSLFELAFRRALKNSSCLSEAREF